MTTVRDDLRSTLKGREVSAEEKANRRLQARMDEAERLARLDEIGRRLYKKLCWVRWTLAREEGLPAYCVVGNQSLMGICEALPKDSFALLQVPGLGPRRVAAYGDILLAAVHEVLAGTSPVSPKLTLGHDEITRLQGVQPLENLGEKVGV